MNQSIYSNQFENELDGNSMINGLSRHDLLSGEPRYIEDEIRNSRFAMIFGALAGVVLLVSLVLSIIMWFIDGKNLITWHIIACFFGMLVAFLCAFWAMDSGKRISVGNPTHPILTLVAFLGSIFFAIYFLTAALAVVFFRYIHFCRLLGWRADQKTWNDRMIDSLSFEKGWWWNSCMLWWIGALALVAGIFFAFIAYTAWSITYNRFKMGRYAMFLASILLIVCGWMAVYWGEECFEWQKYPALAGYSEHHITRGLWVFGIIAIVLGLVGLAVNFLKLGYGYFILAIVAVILFVLVIVFNGFNLRSLYLAETENKLDANCSANLAAIHRDETKQWCPNKYTANTCRKQDLTLKWEDSPQVVASLNPACCTCTKQFYLWPFYMLGLWSMALALSLFVFVASSFYLSENVENYGAAKMVDSLDAVFLALGIIALIVFGILFLVRHNTNSVRTSPGVNNFTDPVAHPDADFPLVHDSIKRASTKVNDGKIHWKEAEFKLPTFDRHSATCSDPATCLLRFAVLSRNAKIVAADKSAVEGSVNSRQQFFPGCTKSSSEYLFFFGNEAEIQKVAKGISFAPKDPSNPSLDAAYYVDQVAASSVDRYGMKNGENPSTALSASESAGCLTGFTASTTANSCIGSCKHTLPSSSLKTSIKGRLYYLDATRAKGTQVPGTVKVQALRDGVPIGQYANLYAGGYFIISGIPSLEDSSYPVTLEISDDAKVYLSDAVDIVVPANADTEVSAGEIQLITKDGKHSAGDTQAVLNARTAAKGQIHVKVTELETGAAVPGVEVKLLNSRSLTGSEVHSATTGHDGNAVFADVLYGGYTAVVNDSNYKNNFVNITHDVAQTKTGVVLAKANAEAMDMTLSARANDPTADFDLKVAARNKAGKECTIEPTNKYCAYGRHLNDVSVGTSGEEVVQIKKLAVAEYKAFVAPAPSFNQMCPELKNTANAHFGAELSWDWNTFKQTTPLKNISFDFSSISSTVKNVGTGLAGALSVIAQKGPVQTAADAEKATVLVSKGGEIIRNIGTTYIPTREQIANNQVPRIEGVTVYGNGESYANHHPATTSGTTTRILTTSAESNYNYVLLSCFTGFGSESQVNLFGLKANVPDWESCTEKIAAKYSVAHLKTQNDAASN